MMMFIKLICSILLFSSIASAHYCHEYAQTSYSKMGHDERLINCLKSDIPFLSVADCVTLANTTKSSEGKKYLLSACATEQGRQGHFKSCVILSNLLPVEAQDASKLYCVEQKYSYTSATECAQVVATIKNVAVKEKAVKHCH